jgi:hypothetical protein
MDQAAAGKDQLGNCAISLDALSSNKGAFVRLLSLS